MARFTLQESFNRTLTWTVLLIAISQFNFGFDQQGFAATQAMGAFDRQFGVWSEEEQDYVLPPDWLALFNGLNYLGFGCGIIIGSIISKRYGRRMCMFVMSCWALIAVTIVITSKSRDQILAGRVLNYIYTGMELAVVPIYQSEIAPGPVRGFVVGTYQMSLLIGGLVINGVARGTSTIYGNAAWRIPFGLFYIIPTLVAACIWFVPESPRWLAMQDRDEEALAALTRFRRGKFNNEQIVGELEAILAVARDRHEKGGFVDMFKTRPNLKRSLIVIGCNFFLQGTGQIFASVYGALFVKSLGTINPFTITLTQAATNIVATTCGMFLVDKVGRRALLMAGGSIQTAALLIMGGLGSIQNPSNSVTSAVVAMMIIFAAGYSFGWAPIVHTLSAELPSLKLRDITYRTASVMNVCIQFAVSFSMPYLLYEPYAALGPRVGFVYGSIALLSVVFAWLLVPDCAGRPLEQIDWLFASGIPMRKFRKAEVPEAAIAMDEDELVKSGAATVTTVENRV